MKLDNQLDVSIYIFGMSSEQKQLCFVCMEEIHVFNDWHIGRTYMLL